MKLPYKGKEWLTFGAMCGTLLCVGLDLVTENWGWATLMSALSVWNAASLDHQLKARRAKEQLKP